MYLRAVGRGFTQINAYFLVMNSKRYNNNNNKCKDNETNNGEDDDDQTHTQKTK